MSKKNDNSKVPMIDHDELLDESQYRKKSPKSKTTKKRQLKTDKFKEEDMSETLCTDFIGSYDSYVASAKNKKIGKSVSDAESMDLRQKLLEVMGQQLEARKQVCAGLSARLADVVAESQADHDKLLDNQQKLKHLTDTMLKCMQQTISAHKHKIKSLNDIQDSFKKQFEELEVRQRAETRQHAEQLHARMSRLKQQLLQDARRRQLELLRQSISKAMQDDL